MRSVESSELFQLSLAVLSSFWREMQSVQPVTPYIWQYQPETGKTAGARQDYGSVINWLGSSPSLCQRIADVNKHRNAIDKETARLRHLEGVEKQEPLAGTGVTMADGKRYRKITRDNLPFPYGWQVYDEDGWRPVSADMSGAGNALSTYPTVISLNNYRSPVPPLRGGSSAKPSGSGSNQELTPFQFARKYPPVVYNRPFSEPLYYFPKEFSPLWDPRKDSRGSSALTMKYRNLL